MRLIDADLMIANGFKDKTIEVRTEDIIKSHEKVVELLFRDAVDFINKQPTVDAVSVVSCKDCKWWKREENHVGETGDDFFCAFGQNKSCREDFYCADGERRSE